MTEFAFGSWADLGPVGWLVAGVSVAGIIAAVFVGEYLSGAAR